MITPNELVIVLDTETTNSIDDPLCYDIGFAVVNPFTGEVIEQQSYVVAEVFLDKELMSYAFFADKIPQYWEDIKAGRRQLAKFSTIRRALASACREYGVTKLFAHNMRFDNRSCNLTQRWLTSSKWRYFFPFGVEMWDTLKMARNLLKDDDAYGEFCYTNDYLTKNGQRRYTAEIIYRFLIDDVTFVEEHKGIEDVLIEKEILKYCLAMDAEMDGKLW